LKSIGNAKTIVLNFYFKNGYYIKEIHVMIVKLGFSKDTHQDIIFGNVTSINAKNEYPFTKTAFLPTRKFLLASGFKLHTIGSVDKRIQISRCRPNITNLLFHMLLDVAGSWFLVPSKSNQL
jgi:hypothetical protein